MLQSRSCLSAAFLPERQGALAIAGVAALVTGGLICSAQSVNAQHYPLRPVRIIVNVSPGGGVDTVARIVAQHNNSTWNQPFVVDNRTGAGGSIGVELTARAAPDGYTLLVCSSGVVTTAATSAQNYDPVRDLQPVTMLTSSPYLIVTAPSLPVNSVKDLIALAQAKPGAVSFASSGTGSILHMGAELLVALSGTKMLHVPYKGVADAYPAVALGDVNWTLGAPVSALPLVRGGRLKAIAVTSLKRSQLLPELPTAAESGLAGYEVVAWFGMFAPARTSPEIISRLNSEAKRALQSPEVARRMANEGTDVIVNAPQEFQAEVKAEVEKWRGLVKKIGAKL